MFTNKCYKWEEIILAILFSIVSNETKQKSLNHKGTMAWIFLVSAYCFMYFNPTLACINHTRLPVLSAYVTLFFF